MGFLLPGINWPHTPSAPEVPCSPLMARAMLMQPRQSQYAALSGVRYRLLSSGFPQVSHVAWGKVQMVLYAESRPEQIAAEWARTPIAYVPWGALEWHGDHLPLGLDGIVAEAFSRMLAERAGGVLLPTQWLPMTALPHPLSLDIPAAVFAQVVRALVHGLRVAGARTVCLFTGHYAQGHEIVLYEIAKECSAGDFRVFAATPLEPLADDSMLDHAGRWETSQLLALRPELVRLEGLSESPDHRHGVLGSSPRLGSAEEGREVLEQALVAWEAWLKEATPATLDSHYERARERYRDYEDRYFRGSWEDAIRAWWAQKQ